MTDAETILAVLVVTPVFGYIAVLIFERFHP